MKRLLALLLAAAMLMSTGCAGQETVPENMISGVGEIEFSAPEDDDLSEEDPDSQDIIGEEPDSSSSSQSQSSQASSSQPESSSQSQSQSSGSSGGESSSSASASESESESESEEEEEDDDDDDEHSTAPSGEMSAVWISYLDLGPMLTGKSRSQFQRAISNAFANVADTGFNTVIVQVRPFGDALYESDYFPWSYLCTGTEGEDPGYDPLEIMVDTAHREGLDFEAWINPYRVRAKGYSKALCDDNQAAIWLEEGNDAVVKYDGGIYYNPGSEEARDLIVDGVSEVLENYDVDGIHFDDYFYPNPNKSFDDQTYAQYDGSLSLANWRRENVNTLVKRLYSTVHSYGSRFGISPTGNNDNNYSQQYADVKKWVHNDGYVDYICPQVYWGFDHSTMPYAETVEFWDDMVRSSSVELVIGIGAYRLGESGEWDDSDDILARMVKKARKLDNYGGIAVYRYDSLYNSAVPDQAQRECDSLSEVL